MDKANKKTAGAVVIVLIIVLLFSWQYIGQEKEKESPMEGEWQVAETISMSVYVEAPIGYSAEFPPVNAHVEGDILTLTSDGSSMKFAMVSDIEAVSMDYSEKLQLYLHNDTLYLFSAEQEEAEGIDGVMATVIVMTRDGLSSVDDDLPDMVGDAYAAIAGMYDDSNAFLQEIAVSVTVDDQDMAMLSLSVTTGDIKDKAIGLLKTDDKGKTVLFCITALGFVFDIVIEDDEVVALTGVDTSLAPTYYVFDGTGILSEDTYGLHSGTVIHRSEETSYDVDGFYEDGRLCEKRADGSSHVLGVQALGIGGAFAMMSGFSAVVEIDGALWMLEPIIYV